MSSVAKAWDAVPELRRRLRATGSIFVSSGQGSVPDINIKNASLNRDAIEPALRAMTMAPRDEMGAVKLFTIAAAQEAFLYLVVEILFYTCSSIAV